jgi:hypothetical protein
MARSNATVKLEPRSIAIMWRRLMPQARARFACDKPAALRAKTYRNSDGGIEFLHRACVRQAIA